jgi:hypothetical protein
MKLTIDKKKILSLGPCIDRFENWEKSYGTKKFGVLEFLELDKITPTDKVWVAVRLFPLGLLRVFAIDCVFASYANIGDRAKQAAYYASLACAGRTRSVVRSGAGCASFKAAWDAGGHSNSGERERQVDALIMLAKDWGLT